MKKTVLAILLCCAALLQAQTKYPTIVIETNYGTMKAMLYDDTPRHNDHYIRLIRQGYFDGTLFHRVVKNFVIQEVLRIRAMPQPGPNRKRRTDMELMPEFREHHFHKKGALAALVKETTRIQKKSDASQLYIVHGKSTPPDGSTAPK